MANQKASARQWRQVENSQVFNATFQACVLELRDRIEDLEANTKQWRIDHLRLANTCASMAPDRIKFFASLMPGEESSTNSNEHELLKRVHSCIVGEPECGHMQARAVIREIAAWLRDHAGGTRAAWMLEQEIDNV